MSSEGVSRLGKYQLKALLGKGGMGTVYQATDVRLQRDVAVKVLPKRMSADGEAVRRFLREARGAARLNHPNVVAIHDVDQKQGYCFLVMELVTGGTAQDLLRDGPLSEIEATRIIADACRGLAAAHDAGLVHRDIKPSNIMRSETGTVKIADFGLAKAADDAATAGAKLTTSGTILGTPQYMSPEQCSGEPLDARSDLYSLGVTYYALLTGRPPFVDSQPMQIMFAHCSKPVPDPRSLRPELSASCVAILLKALEKNPWERYASAAAMLHDLEALLGPPVDGAGKSADTASDRARSPYVEPASFGETANVPQLAVADQRIAPKLDSNSHDETERPAATRPDVAPTFAPSSASTSLVTKRFLRPSRRQLMLALAGGTAAVAAVPLASYFFGSGSTSEKEDVHSGAGGTAATNARPATMKFAAEMPNVNTTLRAAAFSADGQTLFAGAIDGKVSSWNVAQRRFEHEYGPMPKSVRALAVDSRWLAAGSESGAVWLWRLPDRTRRSVIDDLTNEVSALAISPDGRRMAIGTYGDLRLYSLDDDSPRLVKILATSTSRPPASYMVMSTSFSADSRWLAATSWDRKSVSVWKADAGEIVEFREQFPYEPSAATFLPDGRNLMVGTLGHGLFLWRRPGNEVSVFPDTEKLAVRAMAVHQPSGVVFTIGGWGGPVSGFDPQNLRKVSTVDGGHETTHLALSISADGRLAATAGGDEGARTGYLRLWDVIF